jgi:hypothetical protein
MSNGNGATGITLPKLLFTTSIPETLRGRGKGGAENPYKKFMLEMPAPAKGKGKDAPVSYAQFFVPSVVKETITDPAEREKAAKDGCAKLINRFTSIGRHIKKANAAYEFTYRKARDPSDPENGEWGILVYRIAPRTAAASQPAAVAGTQASA